MEFKPADKRTEKQKERAKILFEEYILTWKSSCHDLGRIRQARWQRQHFPYYTSFFYPHKDNTLTRSYKHNVKPRLYSYTRK